PSNTTELLCPATAPPEISTLSLHDALPISRLRGLSRPARHEHGSSQPRRRPDRLHLRFRVDGWRGAARRGPPRVHDRKRKCSRSDRKSTRLNSSHVAISYAVLCLKKNNHIQ